MTLKQEIIQEAKTWIGTPWIHNQQIKGKCGGVDCVQFLVGVAKNVGIKCNNLDIYYPIPNGDSLIQELNNYLTPINLNQVEDGDILVFKIGKLPHHVGIKNGDKLIHADFKHGVQEVTLGESWLKRICAAYTVINTH